MTGSPVVAVVAERAWETNSMRRGGTRGRSALVEIALLGTLAASLLAVSGLPTRADDDEGNSWSDRLSESMKETIGKASHAVGLGKPEPPPTKESPSGCPTISILEGTTAQRVMAAGASGNEGVKYQFSLYHVGRACNATGSQMAVKVGGDGRVLLGPAGGSGRFDVPIRVVIFSEVEQKPVQSKLYRVPASIGAGQAATPFEFVSEMIPVPIASGRSGADYSIKVGIDTGKGAGDVAAKPAKGRRHAKAAKAAPAESASQ